MNVSLDHTCSQCTTSVTKDRVGIRLPSFNLENLKIYFFRVKMAALAVLYSLCTLANTYLVLQIRLATNKK